jgi:hypothetical protein
VKTDTEIFALDLATTCGWARGCVHDVVPTFGSISFGNSKASANAIFANALKWLIAVFEPRPRPDVLILEAMLPPFAMTGETQRATRDRLAGLHAIARAVAYLRGIADIREADVGSVRQHFIGTRSMKSKAAKQETMTKCLRLGWAATTLDESDALALWSFARSRIAPEYAIALTPLFNKHLRVHPQ